jgi:hypothetical protein
LVCPSMWQVGVYASIVFASYFHSVIFFPDVAVI